MGNHIDVIAHSLPVADMVAFRFRCEFQRSLRSDIRVGRLHRRYIRQ
jgi:hypothetical protein